jgi:hypothetical protein
MIDFKLIACRACYLLIPGDLKAALAESEPRTAGRSRVVADMRMWLREHPGLSA